MDKGFTSKGTIEMSKLQKSFLKYIKRKPSFKDIMLCRTMVSLGIVILVEILAVRNK